MTDELTLDPKDWSQIRSLGKRMIDDMVDHMEGLREQPVWQSPDATSRDVLSGPPPEDGSDLEDVYAEFRDHILPYPTGNAHPRFFGWVKGNGTPTGMLADMLASGMNAHVAGYDQSAAMVEKNVIDWMRQWMGFPIGADGVLVSGGTMANINGFAVARAAAAGPDFRENGHFAPGARQMTAYGSAETHSWILKACELMGLGRSAFRAIRVDTNYRVNIPAMRAAIKADIEAGHQPFCIIGTAGTVGTGATDDLKGLRALADEFGLWFHIDGAFGALAAIAPEARQLVEGQETADSLAFDLHKWGYLPFEAACVLIRDGQKQADTFGMSPAYLKAQSRGLSVEGTWFADRGLQLSRGFRALKIWMCFKEYGVAKVGALIDQNIHQAKAFGEMVAAHDDLECLAPVPMNIVCFRYASAPAENLNAVNQEILMRIQESGFAVPSQTMIGEDFAIRVCITNHRTRMSDLEELVEQISLTGKAVCEGR